MGPVDHEERGDEDVPFYCGVDCLRAQAGRAGSTIGERGGGQSRGSVVQ